MATVLLRNNRRAAAAITVASLVVPLGGIILLAFFSEQTIIAVLGWVILITGAGYTAWLAAWTGMPRLALTDHHLLVSFQAWPRVKIPLDEVECFFLGKSASSVRDRQGKPLETATVVIRLREQAKRWHSGHVPASMGCWGDGYITILGTWCEPLDAGKVNHMNSKLAATKRKRSAVPP